MAKMTNAEFSQQASHLASSASHWAADLLTLPEEREEPVRDSSVARFVQEFKERLARIEDWANEEAPTPD